MTACFLLQASASANATESQDQVAGAQCFQTHYSVCSTNESESKDSQDLACETARRNSGGGWNGEKGAAKWWIAKDGEGDRGGFLLTYIYQAFC